MLCHTCCVCVVWSTPWRVQGPDGADVAFDHAEEAMEGDSDMDPSDDDGFDQVDEEDDGFGEEYDDAEDDEGGEDMDGEEEVRCRLWCMAPSWLLSCARGLWCRLLSELTFLYFVSR